MSSVACNDHYGEVSKAAALECKYAVRDLNNQKVVITAPHKHCAPHRKNRRGFYPQGDAVLTLGSSILKVGFFRAEAYSGGVGVQETPKDHRKPGYKTFLNWNLEKSLNDKHLNGLFSPSDEVQYGLGAHCHNHLLVRGFMTKKKWHLDTPENL